MAKRKYRFKWSRVLWLVLIFVTIYTALSTAGHRAEMLVQLERQRALMERQEALQHQLEYHENELDFIGTDEYVEQEARERLGWLKPGEKKYVDSSATEQPREKVDVEPTPSPSVPGPRRTERPAVVPTKSPSKTKEPSVSPAGSPENSQDTKTTEPKPTGTPKSIG